MAASPVEDGEGGPVIAFRQCQDAAALIGDAAMISVPNTRAISDISAQSSAASSIAPAVVGISTPTDRRAARSCIPVALSMARRISAAAPSVRPFTSRSHASPGCGASPISSAQRYSTFDSSNSPRSQWISPRL